MGLGQEDCLPSILGLFMNGAAKLIKLIFSPSILFYWKMSCSFFTHEVKLSLKEICQTLRFCSKLSNFLNNGGTDYKCKHGLHGHWNLVLQVQCKSNIVPFLLYTKKSLIMSSYVLEAKCKFDYRHWIANLPEIMENEFSWKLLITLITF